MPKPEERQAHALEKIANEARRIGNILEAFNKSFVELTRTIMGWMEEDVEEINRVSSMVNVSDDEFSGRTVKVIDKNEERYGERGVVTGVNSLGVFVKFEGTVLPWPFHSSQIEFEGDTGVTPEGLRKDRETIGDSNRKYGWSDRPEEGAQPLTETEMEQRRVAMQGMVRPRWWIGALVKVIDPKSSFYGERGVLTELFENSAGLDFGSYRRAFDYYKLALVSNTTVEERRTRCTHENVNLCNAEGCPGAPEVLYKNEQVLKDQMESGDLAQGDVDRGNDGP